jgi:hypothetical protein
MEPEDTTETPLGQVIAEHDAAEEAKRRAAVLDAVAPDILVRFAIHRLREQQSLTAVPGDRHRALAITKLEEALLWLVASEVL